MIVTQRTVTLGLLALIIITALLLGINEFLSGHLFTTYASFGSSAVFLVLFWLARRDWPYTGIFLTIFCTFAAVFTLSERSITQQFAIGLFIPPVIAMVLTQWRWIVISAASILFLVLWRAGWQGIYTTPFNIIVYGAFVGLLVLGRQIAVNAALQAQQAQVNAEQAAQDLQRANDTLEQRVTERTAEVQANLVALQTQAAEQARLLDENAYQRQTIRDLSVPVIPVSDTTLVMPLIGEIDTERLEYIHTQALRALEDTHAKILVIDITGVPVVDTQVVQGLLSLAQAARLLGSRVLLVGVRPEVAQTIVSLGMHVSSITTYRDLKGALGYRA